MKCYIDGGYDNVNKRNGYCSIKIYDGDKRLYYGNKIPLEDVESSNQAEYSALILCLTYIGMYYAGKEVEIFTDSQLLFYQMSGEWQIHNPKLLELKHKVDGIKVPFKLNWIPRSQIFKELGH